MDQKGYYEGTVRLQNNQEGQKELLIRGRENNDTLIQCEICSLFSLEDPCFRRGDTCKIHKEYIDRVVKTFIEIYPVNGKIIDKEIDRLREIEWIYNGLG